MKHFAIGDGNKRITSEDRYFADRESDDTTVIWDPDHADFPIRVSVLTIVPKDKGETEVGYWRIIEKAGEKRVQQRAKGKKALYSYKEPDMSGEDILHFHEVGIGNSICIFSITVAKAEESSSAFLQVHADLSEMIQSLVQRDEEEQYYCELLVCESEKIEGAVQSLLRGEVSDNSLATLQGHLDRALEAGDADLASQVGLVFGEVMRNEVSSFSWIGLTDDYGTSRALALGDSGILIFPEDMILKRFEKGERLDLVRFSSDTLDTVEDLYRKYQQEAAAGGRQS
ncbi:DUF3806 domain-containing protein [Roseimicrobium sp. ORNL1]|uniref:DUF3806 domain-containing protein n=1 Tax=Roseimicrobium sp. ORNL1 TaxID=2711231 RepID=UPI0013E1E073|nr:DUF3806 domain-containing protein [Roseimicrobium sp. ORNL1]QIF05043.1 DUF3806 domain-containing protein [Roseimicrobium sp. ORNL1]